MGKLSVSWNEIQSEYIKSSLACSLNSPLKCYKNTNVVITLYTTVFNVLAELWKQPCTDQHQNIDCRPSAFQYDALVQDIKSLYDLRDNVLPDDQITFHDDIEVHLGDPVRKLKDWLFCWHPVLLAYASKYAAVATSSTKTLNNYFTELHSKPSRQPQNCCQKTTHLKATPNHLPKVLYLPIITSKLKQK